MERTFHGNWTDVPVIDYVNVVGGQSRTDFLLISLKEFFT